MPTLARRDQDGHVEAVAFVDGEPAFAVSDGYVDLGGRKPVHEGGLLAAAAAPEGRALFTGGEDGRVCTVTAAGVREVCARPGRWIDVMAAGPNGSVGFASGRTAWLVEGDGTETEFACERAVEGLTFFPKGQRLACARYGGASLFYARNPRGSDLAWNGAHTAVTVSPTGAFVVTATQENQLHGWRIAGKGDPHMRMSGYRAKVRSFAWSRGGRWLATSGAPSVVCWPFGGRGPQNQPPKELGAREGPLVARVAFHPAADVVAAGYEDGAVALLRLDDGAVVALRGADASRGAAFAPVTALAFDGRGERLAFGTAGGDAGVVTL